MLKLFHFKKKILIDAMISTNKNQQDKSKVIKIVRLQKHKNNKLTKTVNDYKTKYRIPHKEKIIVPT